MIILGIETSCDETAAAVLKQENGRVQILSNIVASSASLQEKFGGIIPEQAAREQIKSIIPAIETAIHDSGLKIKDIDAIAVTYGPGLIGSLLVGVETAKTLSLIWDKPLIPINHLIGHFYANWISAAGPASSASRRASSLETLRLRAGNPSSLSPAEYIPSFPIIGLLVSGGHTDLVLFKDHGIYEYLGGTRDDAAGECFDKCARLLGLPYPGGPVIAQKAMQFKVISEKLKVNLPRPLIRDKTLDFSFSGLKSAVSREVEQTKKNKELTNSTVAQLSFQIQQAIVDVLVDKTVRAAKKYGVKQIMIAGGVAANQKLVQNLKLEIRNLKLEISLYVPPPNLCTDNGAMIASAAFFVKPIKNPFDLQANPNLSLAY